MSIFNIQCGDYCETFAYGYCLSTLGNKHYAQFYLRLTTIVEHVDFLTFLIGHSSSKKFQYYYKKNYNLIFTWGFWNIYRKEFLISWYTKYTSSKPIFIMILLLAWIIIDHTMVVRHRPLISFGFIFSPIVNS